MTLTEREDAYGPLIARVCSLYGIPPAWGIAIARQETSLRPDATNLVDIGDIRRGGSWGMCQMSLRTARGLGYLGDGQGLLDPELNVTIAAQHLKQLATRFGADNLEDVASAYNSGKPFKVAPFKTRTVYVPNVLEYAKEYAGRFSSPVV